MRDFEAHRTARDRGLRRRLDSRRPAPLAREFDLGGVILFARNVVEPEQVAELSREAQALARELPLWVSVDQEGGRVARLKAPFTDWPPMMTLGRSGDEQLAAAVRARAGRRAEGGRHHPRLHAGPRRPHQSRQPGDRRPRARRARRGRRAARARRSSRRCSRQGIAACGKHFPGPRRHQHRFASRAAAGRASAGSARRRRARAVPAPRSRPASRRS